MNDMLTVEDVQARMAMVRRYAEVEDHEGAHATEDEIHILVLVAIATDRCTNPAAVARAAVASKNIDFRRDCA